ncbi:MAG: pentapeptide repeat-containing protein [Candidatus Tectomicrobia bacterium]|nr:pentapeptide repeat-containing protein [Candidatus Tectomicrobia bacterium]
MANEEHLAILKQGVKVWNAWRKKNPKVRPDLRGVDLSGADLSEADLRRADLSGADLFRADLSGAKLSFAILSKADLLEADLLGAKLGGAKLSGAKLLWADLSGADLSGASLGGASLFQANLFRANLTRAKLSGASLKLALLLQANLSGANLTNTDLSTANLIGAEMDGATLTGVKLWETQRAGWSIKGVICERASWDKEGKEFTEYAPGEFERLFSDRTKVVLHYEGNISPIEVATLPAVLAKLEEEHPGCILRLQSIQGAAGGATVTIAIDDPGEHDPATLQEELREAGRRYQAAMRGMLEERSARQQIEMQLDQLQKKIFPLLLEKATAQSRDAAPTRKFLTVLFLDLAGFSRMPEEERQSKLELLRGFASTLLEQGEGRYTNTWGDAIVAGFENSNDGVSCACTLIEVLKAAGIAARIGMSRGEALVHYNPLTDRADIDGDSINEGSRLEPMAKAGEVLISEELRYHPESDEDRFIFEKVLRPLHKDVGVKKEGETIECYTVRLKPKAEP